MEIEKIDAILGDEAKRLNDQPLNIPLDFYDGYCWTVKQICKMDIQQVTHGKWSRKSYRETAFFTYKCSVCGEETIGRQKYCPNCGARMDEVKQ